LIETGSGPYYKEKRQGIALEIFKSIRFFGKERRERLIEKKAFLP